MRAERERARIENFQQVACVTIRGPLTGPRTVSRLAHVTMRARAPTTSSKGKPQEPAGVHETLRRCRLLCAIGRCYRARDNNQQLERTAVVARRLRVGAVPCMLALPLCLLRVDTLSQWQLLRFKWQRGVTENASQRMILDSTKLKFTCLCYMPGSGPGPKECSQASSKICS